MHECCLAGVSLDLTTLRRTYSAGQTGPRELIREVLRRVRAYEDKAVWLYRVPEVLLLEQADGLERRASKEHLPLYGVPFALKDNIDVAAFPTTAACPAFGYTAERTAPVVKRLQEAGALFVGKTNLDQFATGLAGDRSPAGACRNPFNPAHISGGSSSGSAVAVAAGLVSFALGTDTAGSGRVPAGCNNIVGLKPTPGRLDTEGVVPACRSLDCVSVFALTASDALRVYEVAAGSEQTGAEPTPDSFVFAVPARPHWEFFGDRAQKDLFETAITRLEQLGGRRTDIDFQPLREVAALLYEGPWLAERLAGLSDFIRIHGDDMHPVTRQVIEGGARFTAVDVFLATEKLQRLRKTCSEIFESADVLIVPTMPTIPTLADVQADSVGWSRRLGQYTNFVNLLGWAALALPAGLTPDGLPGGITLVGPAGSEAKLCVMGRKWQEATGLKLGATGHRLPERIETPASKGPAPGCVRVAVAGAHLRGQPLHADLVRTGARFVRSCRTAARYRFVALMHLDPPRPGLIREDAARGAATVEIYDLPLAGFGALVSSVAPPLAIGTIELEDGETVKGFLCESWAAAQARDITDFGGWAAFRADSKPAKASTVNDSMGKGIKDLK